MLVCGRVSLLNGIRTSTGICTERMRVQLADIMIANIMMMIITRMMGGGVFDQLVRYRVRVSMCV